MRQLQLIAHGEPSDVIELNTVSEPALGPEDVLISMEAAPLNPSDGEPVAFPRVKSYRQMSCQIMNDSDSAQALLVTQISTYDEVELSRLRLETARSESPGTHPASQSP
jgi:hypothetical protein